MWTDGAGSCAAAGSRADAATAWSSWRSEDSKAADASATDGSASVRTIRDCSCTGRIAGAVTALEVSVVIAEGASDGETWPELLVRRRRLASVTASVSFLFFVGRCRRGRFVRSWPFPSTTQYLGCYFGMLEE
jgi:hypothetical protein